jgi:alanine racemase
MPRPTRAVVDLSAIASNYRLLRTRARGAEVIPVVKADAYGHGAVPVSRRLETEGARRLAVATFEEARELRDAGIEAELYLLSSGDPEDAAEAAARRIVPVLHDLEQARAMEESARKLPGPLRVQLKLDTGLGRLGVRPEALGDMIALLAGQRHRLVLAGTFTQLASATEPQRPETAAQLESLAEALAALRASGLDPGLVHASNSAGVLAFPGASFDAVRPGIALYGVPPSAETDDPALVPAMTVETRVLAVKRVPAGTPLGYGGTFVTSRPSDVASLPIGYHDGLRRSFTGRTSILLERGRAPIVGAVSMDLTLVDATGLAVHSGDRAVLLGRLGRESVRAWELANAASTNAWEILCGIGARVPRTYPE